MVSQRRIRSLWRSLLLRALPALLLATGFARVAQPQHAQASTTPAHAQTPGSLTNQSSAPNATSVDVLLLHGLEGQNSAVCRGAGLSNPTYVRWDAFYQVNSANFAGISWNTSLIHPLKYFSGDTNCGPGIPGGTDDGDIGNDGHCNDYYNTGTLETNNEDIRHIACRFYWFVYTNYTAQGRYVHILAHSMGGIIAKWALSEAGKDSSHFPFALLIYNVVTLSTPFQGVPDTIFGQLQQVSATIACNGCYDAQQLEVGSNSPNSIISSLNSFSSTEGSWTVIGAYGNLPGADQFFAAVPSPYGGILAGLFDGACDYVDLNSALQPSDTIVSPGPSLSSATVVYYDQCVLHEQPLPGYIELPVLGIKPLPPGSVSYQDDASTNKDYSGYQGTVGNWGSYITRALPHPLAKALEALGVTRGPNTYPYLSQMPYTYAANNGDGRLEVFARGSDGNIWHDWQKCPGCSWNGWSVLQSGHAFNGDPTVGQDEDGRLEVFARGTNNDILVNAQTIPTKGKVVNGWGGWHVLSQSYAFQGTPMAARNTNKVLEVFARGSDGNIWHNWETTANGTTWNGWVALQSGYHFKGDPVVGINSDGRLEVFALGSDGNIWHNWQLTPHGSWHGWATLQSGQSFVGRLSVGRNADGRLEVYALDWGNNVLHDYEQSGGGWSGWVQLQTPYYIFNSTPAVGNNQDGHLEVFSTENAQGDIWHNWQLTPNGDWNGWSSLQSGYRFLGASPATGNDYDGRLEVYAFGTNNSLWFNYVQVGGGWKGWQQLQSGYSFSPTSCAAAPSDEYCNRADPITEQCNDFPQETVSNAYISVTLHYSTNCQGNWSSAKSLNSQYVVYKVAIERQAAGSEGALNYYDIPGTSTWYTNMVWSPNNPARSCVWYSPPDFSTISGPVCTAWH